MSPEPAIANLGYGNDLSVVPYYVAEVGEDIMRKLNMYNRSIKYKRSEVRSAWAR